MFECKQMTYPTKKFCGVHDLVSQIALTSGYLCETAVTLANNIKMVFSCDPLH